MHMRKRARNLKYQFQNQLYLLKTFQASSFCKQLGRTIYAFPSNYSHQFEQVVYFKSMPATKETRQGRFAHFIWPLSSSPLFCKKENFHDRSTQQQQTEEHFQSRRQFVVYLIFPFSFSRKRTYASITISRAASLSFGKTSLPFFKSNSTTTTQLLLSSEKFQTPFYVVHHHSFLASKKKGVEVPKSIINVFRLQLNCVSVKIGQLCSTLREHLFLPAFAIACGCNFIYS